jgi:hypothetical protein
MHVLGEISTSKRLSPQRTIGPWGIQTHVRSGHNMINLTPQQQKDADSIVIEQKQTFLSLRFKFQTCFKLRVCI